MPTIRIGEHTYSVSAPSQDLSDLVRWRALESDGLWTACEDGFTGEWVRNSPSLFFSEKIAGDYLWRTKVTRLEPGAAFTERFSASKFGAGKKPDELYNFNFWLRADAPPGEDFFGTYPTKLGSGWNGMGDDYWRSYFTTVVRGVDGEWVRLRRSPGYAKVREARGVVPDLPYNEPHVFSFALRRRAVRMYFDETLVYEYADPAWYESGYVGVCVWLAVVRFEEMRLYRFEA
jgi:hypothetical protein